MIQGKLMDNNRLKYSPCMFNNTADGATWHSFRHHTRGSASSCTLIPDL